MDLTGGKRALSVTGRSEATPAKAAKPSAIVSMIPRPVAPEKQPERSSQHQPIGPVLVGFRVPGCTSVDKRPKRHARARHLPCMFTEANAGIPAQIEALR